MMTANVLTPTRYCRSCDVFGTGDRCWMCRTDATWAQARPRPPASGETRTFSRQRTPTR